MITDINNTGVWVNFSAFLACWMCRSIWISDWITWFWLLSGSNMCSNRFI